MGSLTGNQALEPQHPPGVQVGRRIRITLTFVEDAFVAIEKLAERLEATAQATA